MDQSLHRQILIPSLFFFIGIFTNFLPGTLNPKLCDLIEKSRTLQYTISLILLLSLMFGMGCFQEHSVAYTLGWGAVIWLGCIASTYLPPYIFCFLFAIGLIYSLLNDIPS